MKYMQNFAANGISTQVIVIFTLALIVAILLIVIIFLDRKEKIGKKKKDEEVDDYDENFTFEDLYQQNTIKENNNVIHESFVEDHKELGEELDNTINELFGLKKTDIDKVAEAEQEVSKSDEKPIEKEEIEETPIEEVKDEEPVYEEHFSNVIVNDIEDTPIEEEINEKLDEIIPIKEVIPEEITIEEPIIEEVPIVEEIKVDEPVIEEPVIENPPIIKKINEDNEEEDIYVEPDLEKTQAQLELERLTEELEKLADAENNSDLNNFENEQEENAIISLDELEKVSDQLYDKNEEVQYQDEGNEPITIEQLREKFKIKEENPMQMTLDDFINEEPIVEEKSAENKKFESSPFISPIYGIEPDTKEEPIEEEIPTVEESTESDLEEEIRKTNEFLQTLKELQKNLD